jgi:C4-dicarboxylate-specific signal transduction histidine kinase
VETSSESEARALQSLMQRQLPQITQRLNVTLDKLQAPQQADTSMVDAAIWWDALRQRYAHRNVRFEANGAARGVRLPAELFDSVADNLIENALHKKPDTEDYQVRVTFSPEGESTLTVCDNGAAVPKQIAGQLFATPVSSRTGLGVGLYHAAKQAADLGYRLTLAANESGIVCFALAKGKDGQQAG